MQKEKKPPGAEERAMEFALAVQRLINSGEAWKFPATYGRAAIEAIRDGKALFPTRELIPGKPGSEEFVKAKLGEEYLEKLKVVK